MIFDKQLDLLFKNFLVPIDDPTSRLFHLNFIFVLVFTIFWLIFTKKNISPDLIKNLFFNRKYWWNKSTKTDYKLYFFNSLLKVFLFIPFLDISYFISINTLNGLKFLFKDFSSLETTHTSIFIFSLVYFIFDDFLRFFHHIIMHKVPFLWNLHKVHHSARILTPITLYRTHPIESAIATIRNSLAIGLTTGFFIFIFESRLQMTTILGIHFIGFMFNFLGSNLRHSHIPISFGFLEYFFISPKQHQIHHSVNPKHFNLNFGVSLSIWDQLFKTFIVSKNQSKLRFGL